MQKRAFLIGVDEYEHVTPLDFCGADARDYAAALRGSLQFADSDVVELTVRSRVKPQRNEIFHNLGAFLQRGITEDGLLIFYFSGHGMIDSKDSKDYLLPIDASPYNLKETGIRVEGIVEQLSSTRCKNIVMFLDACREAIEGGKSIESSIGEDSKVAASRAGIVTFFSCNPREKSYEIQSLGHGSFTHCILDAIAKGECNTVSEIDQFLRAQVPIINSTHNKPAQLPYTVIEPAEKGQLAIFYSETRRKQVDDKYEILVQQLSDFFAIQDLDAVIYDKAIQLIERAYRGDAALTTQETKKLNWISLLCDGTFHRTSFERAWLAMDRQLLKASPTQRELKRLDEPLAP